MANEEYEILPHKLLEDLKYDVEALKKKLSQPDAKMNELLLEVEGLKDSIHDLNEIFKKALEETKGEDPANMMTVVSEKLQAVVAQNETIAKGMIAISDKLEDFMNKQSGLSPRPPVGGAPIRHNMSGPQPYPGTARMAPPPQMDVGNDMDLPPPPPGNKRRGLFK